MFDEYYIPLKIAANPSIIGDYSICLVVIRKYNYYSVGTDIDKTHGQYEMTAVMQEGIIV